MHGDNKLSATRIQNKESLLPGVVSEVIMEEMIFDLSLEVQIGFEEQRKRTMLQEVETDRTGRMNCYKTVWR